MAPMSIPRQKSYGNKPICGLTMQLVTNPIFESLPSEALVLSESREKLTPLLLHQISSNPGGLTFIEKERLGSSKLVFVRNTRLVHSSLESRDEIPVRGVEL